VLSFALGSFRYDVFANSTAAFAGAESICTITGGHLSSITSESEAAAVSAAIVGAGLPGLIGNGTTVELWFGLRVNMSLNTFFTDGSDLLYLPEDADQLVVDGACYGCAKGPGLEIMEAWGLSERRTACLETRGARGSLLARSDRVRLTARAGKYYSCVLCDSRAFTGSVSQARVPSPGGRRGLNAVRVGAGAARSWRLLAEPGRLCVQDT
jgi:hypothetical protein